MADGTIQIDVEVDGKQIPATSKELDRLGNAGQKSGSDLKSAEDGVKGVSNESEKAGISIGKVATALGLVAVASAAFKLLRDSVGEAVQRFDTLERFPKVLQGLGVSAEDSERSMAKLSDGIDGLPTKLDDIANTAQRMYSSFGDMDLATDSALALNNALLASGASTEEARRGTEMYLKALQTGKMDMVTWRSLSETMNVGLDEVAGAFGFAGKSAKEDLYKALQDGSITMDEFNDKLVEVGTGTGRLAELAKENSKGITTSLNNLKYAAAIGIADIIKAFDNLSKEVTGNTIAENIDNMKGVIRTAFAGIVTAIETTTPAFKVLATVVSVLLTALKPLTPALIGLATAFAIHATVHALTNAIKANTVIQAAASAITNAYTVATSAQGRAMVLNGIQIKATSLIMAAYNGVVALATTAHGLLTGGITLASVATSVFTGAVGLLSTAMQFLMGPVGWVTLAIGALVGTVIGIVAWFNKATEEGERLAAENEKLSESTDTLSDSVESNAKSYEETMLATESAAEANRKYAEEIELLAEKENKSAAEKQLLNDKVELLNESVEGLSLSYNAEADALSMSSEEISGRIDLLEQTTSYNDALERQKNITQEQIEVERQLSEIVELRKQYHEEFTNGTIKTKEYKEGIAELDEQSKELNETSVVLADQQESTSETIRVATETVAEATEGNVARMKVAYDDLSESQQATVDSMKETWQDYQAAATDMFDTLSDEVTITVDEMAQNLEENTRIVGEWGENIAELAERGVDDGLLETLRQAGPESAGHVNALVNASDEELAELSTGFKEGGDTATQALSDSLGIEESGILDSVGHLVTGMESSLKEEVNSKDFQSIGLDLTGGLGEGIEEGTEDVKGKAKGMADDTTNATKDAFQTRSPSVVFKGIGGDLTDGLALGINQGSSKVVSAINNMFKSVEASSKSSFSNLTSGYERAVAGIMRTLVKLSQQTKTNMDDVTQTLSRGASQQKAVMTLMDMNFRSSSSKIDHTFRELIRVVILSMDSMEAVLSSGAAQQVTIMRRLAVNMISPFRIIPSNFRAIGMNAMAGLRGGLNAGRGSVMSTARGIANQVSRTMRASLKIKSPSRVMRDDIGKMIPAGLAQGIEANASNAYDAMSAMTKGLMSKGTPEMALGTGRMTYTGNSNNAGITSSIKSSAASGDNGLVGVLKEQTKILSNIARKNPNLYIDGEKVTKVVNDNNAIMATFRVFD